MADVITRFRLETTQYDSQLKSAAKELADFSRTATQAAGGFNDFTKSNVEASRALGSMATSTNNAKDQTKELVSAFNEAAKAYNALTEEQKSSDFGKALAGSLTQLKQRIDDTKNGLQTMGDQGRETGGIFSAFKERLMFNVDALGLLNAALKASSSVLDVVKDAFFSSETNVDEWGRTVAAAEGIYDSFCIALNSGDFSNFFANLDNVIDKAKAAYDAIDQLKTVMTIINPERAELQAEATKQKAIIRREGRDSDAGKQAQQRLKELEVPLTKAFEKESKMNYAAFEALVKLKLAEGGLNLNQRSYDQLMKSFHNSDSYEFLKSNAEGSITFERIEHKNNPYDPYTGNVGRQLVDTRNTEQKLLDIFTDEWRQKYSPFLTASFNATGAAQSVMLSDARYVRENNGGGGGGSTGGRRTPSTTTTAEIIPVGSVKALNKELAELRKQQELATTTEEWKAYQTYIDGITNSIKRRKGELAAPLTFEQSTGKLEKELQDQGAANIAKLGDINGTGTELAKNIAQQIKVVQDANKKYSDKKDVKLTDAMGAMAGGMNSVVSGLDQLGIEIPDGLKEVINGIQAVTSILSGIAAIVSAIQSITAADAILPFACGGIVPKAAAGMLIPGNSYSGDNLRMPINGTGRFIGVNSGELILNAAQQNNLASQMTGEEQAAMVQPYVDGEKIFLGMNNAGRRLGYGEIVTTKMLHKYMR